MTDVAAMQERTSTEATAVAASFQELLSVASERRSIQSELERNDTKLVSR